MEDVVPPAREQNDPVNDKRQVHHGHHHEEQNRILELVADLGQRLVLNQLLQGKASGLMGSGRLGVDPVGGTS